MGSRLATWMIAKLRNRRKSVKFRRTLRLFSFGAIYHGTYSNYKNDRVPLIFAMYSNDMYTHAININHLLPNDRNWLLNTIFLIKKGNQVIDGITFYKLLKLRKPTMLKGYRVYFTKFLKMRLVSPGITNLKKLLYKSENFWVSALNRKISAGGLSQTSPVAYNVEELRSKIIEAHNTTLLTSQTVNPDGPAFGRAVYLKD